MQRRDGFTGFRSVFPEGRNPPSDMRDLRELPELVLLLAGRWIDYGLTRPSSDSLIRLGFLAAGNNLGPEVFTNIYTHGVITVTGHGKGIQCVAELIQHEQCHIDTYNRFHAQGDDPDGDGIPTSEEASYYGISTHPNDPDTYNMKAYNSVYWSYGDDEIRCRKVSTYSIIPIFPNLDWANPGCQNKHQLGPTVP